MNQITQWIEHLFQPGDIVELRCFNKHDAGAKNVQLWFAAQDAKSQANRMLMLNTKGYDVYCGVCPRTRKGGGRAEDVALARVMWLDFDEREGGGYFSADEVREAVRRAGLPEPTMMVSSGHGIHTYWRLTDPVQPDVMEKLLTTIAPKQPKHGDPVKAYVPEADPKATDRARIMRVPGLTNVKVPLKPVPCMIVSLRDDLTYDFDALVEGMGVRQDLERPAASPSTGSGQASGPSTGSGQAATSGSETAASPPPRQSGNRPSDFERASLYMQKRDPAIQGSGGDEHTYKTACILVNDFALSDAQALELMTAWNMSCVPPWDEYGLMTKIRSARRSASKPKGNLLSQDGKAHHGQTKSRPGRQGSNTEQPPARAGGGDQHIGDLPAVSGPPDGAADAGAGDSGHAGGGGGDADGSDDDRGSCLANFTGEFVQDDEGNDKPIAYARHIRDIFRQISTDIGDDLGCIGENLFFARAKPDNLGRIIRFINGTDALFALLHARYESLSWRNTGLDCQGNSFVTRAVFASGISHAVKSYRGVSQYPFEPERYDIFTRWQPDSKYTPTGEYFTQFCDFFRPSTPEDANLIAALTLTMFWGGRAGKRPLFIIAPEDEGGEQQSAGKSSLVKMCSRLVGGHMDLSMPRRGSFADGLNKQALEEVNMGYRVAVIDNHTGVVRDADFTKIITQPVISGRASYAKQAERSNLITWIITTNEPHLSDDIASRTVMIKLSPCDRDADPTWESRVDAFLQEHGRHVAMDCIAILGRDDKEQIEARHTRFPEWDTQVLGCLTNTRDTIEMIHQRQREADTDRAEIEEFLQQLKKSRGTCCELDTKTLCEDWKRFFGKELSTAQMGTILKNAAAKGRLSGLKRKTKKNGSPWIWSPYDVESGESEEMMPSPSPSPGGQNGGSIFAPSPDNVQNVQGDDF